MVLDSQYFSEQPISRIEEPTNDDLGGDDDSDEADEDGERAVGGFRIGGADPAAPSKPEEALAPGGKPLSARLYDELAMQRRDILAASILGDPALALDFLIFVMADSRFGQVGYGSSRAYGSTIRASAPQDPIVGEQPATSARSYLAEAKEGLDAGWSEDKDEVARFEAFRALSDDSKAAWRAYVVARSLEAKAGYGVTEHIPLHNRLAAILEVDVASWWRPTAENFFDRVSKASILTLLSEVGGAALVARHATLKKGEIAGSCQKLFAGESIVQQEVKEAALQWVPAVMRFTERADGCEAKEQQDDEGHSQWPGMARSSTEAGHSPIDAASLIWPSPLRLRSAGRIPPVGEITENTDDGSRSNMRPIELIDSPRCQRSHISVR